jgi:hypothetical protein
MSTMTGRKRRAEAQANCFTQFRSYALTTDQQSTRRTHMMINLRGVVLAAFAILALNGQALNGEAMAGEKGKACKVTAGANQGKSGKYGDSGEWCQDSWGATECTDQQGRSRCEDALVATDGGVVVVDGKGGIIVVETGGLYETPDKGVVRCTTSISDVAGSTAICFPVLVGDVEQLSKSQHEPNRSLAEALKTAIGRLPARK